MITFTVNYPNNTSEKLKCLYKITIGDMFYYGSTIDYRKRVSTHISTMNTNRCLNSKFKYALKANKNVTFDVVYISDTMKDIVDMEHFFVSENINNLKSLNVVKSAYQNQRWYK